MLLFARGRGQVRQQRHLCVGGCDQLHTRTASIFRSDTLWTQGAHVSDQDILQQRGEKIAGIIPAAGRLRWEIFIWAKIPFIIFIPTCLCNTYLQLRVWGSQKIVWCLTLFQSDITRFRIRKVWYKIKIMKKKWRNIHRLKVVPSVQGSRAGYTLTL